MVESVALVVNATEARWIASLLAQTFHCQYVRVAAVSHSGETVVHSQAQGITVPKCNAVHQLCTYVRNGNVLIMCMFTITPHSHASYLGDPRLKS